MFNNIHLEDLEEDDDEDDNAKNDNSKQKVSISKNLTIDEIRKPIKPELPTEQRLVIICI